MPPLVQSVLVAVDFGEASARAVAVAGAIAERCHAGMLTLLHSETIEAPPYFTSEQIQRLEAQRHALAAQAEAYLTRFGRQHCAMPFATRLGDGPPAEAILREAANADLVVMGTHGRRGVARWWLGSVAERVLREIARPLLVVHADMDRAPASLFAQPVVYTGVSPTSGAAAVQLAHELATCFGGGVADIRHARATPPLDRGGATVLVVSTPEPRTQAWPSSDGEPLLRRCTVPILFVPESEGGAV